MSFVMAWMAATVGRRAGGSASAALHPHGVGRRLPVRGEPGLISHIESVYLRQHIYSSSFTVDEMQALKTGDFYRGSEGVYPWAVLAIMVGAFLAASLAGLSGPTTSFAIGLVGLGSIAFRLVYGWWLLLKGKLYPDRREMLASMMASPLLTVLNMVGWLGVIILTVLSLG